MEQKQRRTDVNAAAAQAENRPVNQVEFQRKDLSYEMNEAFKLLRTNILFSGEDKRVILTTSAVASEGKSTVTLNLARSLAETEQNVLLIDTDMRKSVLHHQMTSQEDMKKARRGLSHYLSGLAPLQDVVFHTEMPGLDVIFAGKTPPNPTELLSNQKMKNLVAMARDAYDYVLVDCPPVHLVVDASIVAPLCDGIVITIKAGEIPAKIAQDVVKQMKLTNCPILGVVLNGVDYKNGGKYYSRYYGKYYGKY